MQVASSRRPEAQEVLYFRSGPEDNHTFAILEILQALENRTASPSRVGPDPLEKIPTETLGTSGRQFGARLSTMERLPFDDAPQTHEARNIQKYDCVTGIETQIECSTIVAVDNPGIVADQPPHLLPPLILECRFPTRVPVE